MIKVYFLLAISLLLAKSTFATPPPSGFISVFNGVDLSGWQGSPHWTVEDSALTGTTDGTLKRNQFIVWQGAPLKNFELQVMVKVSAGGNSGIQYRGKLRPDLGPYRVSGYQCDVVAKVPKFHGMLYEEMGRRILARTGNKVIIDTLGQPWITHQQPVDKLTPDTWQHFRILAEGNRLRHWVNGKLTVDVIDLDEKNRALEGVLAVQVHVGPAMKIQFKDFFLKRLPDTLAIIENNQIIIPDQSLQVKPQGRLPKDWAPVTYSNRHQLADKD